MKKLRLLLCLLLCAGLLSACAYLPTLGYGLYQNSGTSANPAQTAANDDTVILSKKDFERYAQFTELLEMMDIVNEYYIEDVDAKKMVESAAAGLLRATGDPYTFYYTAEDYKKLWEDDEGEYAGVGIQITSFYDSQKCIISRVFKGSPAEAAGVKKGDLLYKVEDMLVYADNVDDAVAIMRGTPGTPVHVTFLRGDEQIEFDLVRAKINVNRVAATMLPDNIGYIYLYEFAGTCEKEFAAEAEKLVADGAKGLIIDLRDNPGGWVEAARSIADLFVDKGIVCYLEYKDGTREYYDTTDGKIDLPLVVLVNESSASSSEILSGCLQDRANATVVGVQSYGKGIVQSVIPLSTGNGSAMQVTIAQYYTPNGNAVHGIGITPDVPSPLPEGDTGDYDFADLNDPQLQEALRVMREKLGLAADKAA